jgi:hypothetical protein
LDTAWQRQTGWDAISGSFLPEVTERQGKAARGGRNRQDVVSSGGLQD